MADNENSVIEINFDTGKIEDGLNDLMGGISAIKTAMAKLDQSINKGFASGMRLLQGIETETKKTSGITKETIKTLTGLIKENTSTLVNEVKKVIDSIGGIISERQQTDRVDAFFKAADFITKIPGSGHSPNTTRSTPNAPRPMIESHAPLGLPAPKSDEGTSANSLISGAMQNIVDKLPFDKESLINSIGEVTGKLKEMSLAWAAETRAKIASNAESLKTVAMNAVEHVKAFGAMLGHMASSTAAWLANTAAKVGNTAASWAQIAATTAWQAICTAATAVTSAFGAAMSFLTSPITLVVAGIAALIAIIVLLVKNWDTVKATAISVWETIKEAFGNAWKWFQDTVLEPLANGFKGMVNGIIGFINGLIAGVVDGINTIIGMLNKINFDIPDWVPGLGGQTFGFNLTPLTAPQIPLLAKGAVLPANKPFLAVVGDQRHGTNIEAPLATIQEAVALVMNDQVAAMMAGFEATVEEVRLLRQMVSGIEIGDSTIGQAARRYERKMAVVTGGRY